MTAIIEAKGLTKRFGDVRALDGLDIVAQSGQVTALLGPNGAGKTTFVRAVATLLRPDGGEIYVAGIDACAKPKRVREIIGLAGQFASVEPAMTPRRDHQPRACHRRGNARRAQEPRRDQRVIEVRPRVGGDLPAVEAALGTIGCETPHTDMDAQRVSGRVEGGADQLRDIVRLLDERGIEADDVGLRRPSLDEVFLAVTGKPLEPTGSDSDRQAESADAA